MCVHEVGSPETLHGKDRLVRIVEGVGSKGVGVSKEISNFRPTVRDFRNELSTGPKK